MVLHNNNRPLPLIPRLASLNVGLQQVGKLLCVWFAPYPNPNPRTFLDRSWRRETREEGRPLEERSSVLCCGAVTACLCDKEFCWKALARGGCRDCRDSLQ